MFSTTRRSSMRKILSGIVVLALSFLLIAEWTESLTSSENTSEKPSETKSPTQKPLEPKNNYPQTAKVASPRPATIDPALEEILRIREETGSPLHGSLLEKISRSA